MATNGNDEVRFFELEDETFLVVNPEDKNPFLYLLKWIREGHIPTGATREGDVFEEKNHTIPWQQLVSLFCMQLLSVLAGPMAKVGRVLELIGNILIVNGGLVRTIFLSLCSAPFLFKKGPLLVPSRDSTEYLSLIGMIDPRRALLPWRISSSSETESADSFDSAANRFGVFPAPSGDRRIADVMLMAAKFAYENAAVIEKVVTNDWGMNFVGFFNGWNECQKNSNTQFFLFTDQVCDANAIVVAWRGTEPFNAYDWITNIDFSWYDLQDDSGKVHLGFLEALGLGDRHNMETFLQVRKNAHAKKQQKSSLDVPQPHLTRAASGLSQKVINDKILAYDHVTRVVKELLKEHPKAKLFITGHSLGGALSLLYSGMLFYFGEDAVTERIAAVYSFGQPKVGEGQFGEFMCKKLAVERYFRVVYCNDVVPRVPFDDPIFKFRHWGLCYYFGSLMYDAQTLREVPDPNYFSMSLMTFVTIHMNAILELKESLIMSFKYGPEYKESWASLLFRICALVLPGIGAHSPVNYLYAMRLGKPMPLIPELYNRVKRDTDSLGNTGHPHSKKVYKSAVWARQEAKEPGIIHKENDAMANKGISVAEEDAKKLNITALDHKRDSRVGTSHNHLGHERQQDFVEDFTREIRRGGSGYFVSKAWLSSLEELDKEIVMSILSRAKYLERHQTLTAIIYRRVENNVQIPTVYNYPACTLKNNDLLYGDNKQLLASNDIGDSLEIEEQRYSTKTQDGKLLCSASQRETSGVLDSEISTVSSSQNELQLARGQTDESHRLGSPRSLRDNGKTAVTSSDELLKSFKTALKDTDPDGYLVSTQWLSTLSDHEVEDLNMVLCKSGYSQIDKTNTTTCFKRHDHISNNPGYRSETPNTSEKISIDHRGRASTFQGTGFSLPEKYQDFNMDDTEVTSGSQARQRQSVDCECLPQDLEVTVSRKPSFQCPMAASTSSSLGATKYSTTEQVGDCYVTMPKKRKQRTVDTRADKIIEMKTVSFNEEGKSYVQTASLEVSAVTSLRCCLTNHQSDKKVRFEFTKIQGAVNTEESMKLETSELVLRALRTNVVGCTKAEQSEGSEVDSESLPLCPWYHDLKRFQSIDGKGQTPRLVWMGISAKDPRDSEPGSITLELQCDDIFYTDSDLKYHNQVLLFRDHDSRVVFEGDIHADLDPKSILELDVRYQLEICHNEACDQDKHFVSFNRETKIVDFDCILEFSCRAT